MIDDSHFYIIEQDLFETASGFGEMQDTTAFTAAPSGTFVFKAHEIDTSSRVGGITITAGAIAGTEDFLSLGYISSNMPVATSVAMTLPDATNVRGTFTLTDGSSFHYYVVNSGKFYIMSDSASGSLEIGQAEAQTGGPFSAATLAAGASYVFGSSGDTSASGLAGIHSAGVFTSDGSGDITTGAVDYVQDTTVNSNLSVSGGTYTLAASGRGTINLTLAGGTISPQIFWMVNGTRAYFLADSTLAVEDGTFSLQQGAPFTALTSQAAFVMDGFDVAFKDRVGLFKPTSGGFNWNPAANSFYANSTTRHPPPLPTTAHQACAHGVLQHVKEFLLNMFCCSQRAVERFLLPDSASAVQKLVDTVRRGAFDSLHDLRRRDRPLRATNRHESQMNVIRHDD